MALLLCPVMRITIVQNVIVIVANRIHTLLLL
jgi:hypothetical protein